MKSFGFILDRRQYDQALREYAAGTKKDHSEVCNRQMLNLAIQGIKLTKQAEESAIQKLQSFDWWPKYIAKILSAKKFQKVTKAFGKSQKSGQRAQERFMRRSYTREQARVFSRKVIRKRLVAVRFLKYFFSALGKAVKPYTKGGSAGIGKSFKGFTAKITPATPDRPRCDITVVYTYLRRKSKTAAKTERLLNNSLRLAYPAVAKDMRDYLARKARERAAQHSARKVA